MEYRVNAAGSELIEQQVIQFVDGQVCWKIILLEDQGKNIFHNIRTMIYF